VIGVRDADPGADAPACAAIYAPFVAGSAVSFEEAPPDAAEMAERIAAYQARHPWLVADQAGRVAGFAYAAPHRARPAYRWAVEVSVYVDERDRGRGVGRRLYDALLPRLAAQNLVVALAGITLPNAASVALHEACGFTPVGVFRRVGFKAGAWRDVGWWQRSLADGLPVPPGEPQPPATSRRRNTTNAASRHGIP
jgi:phosphinothricin acetyltransferase